MGGRWQLPDPERFVGKRDGVRSFVEKVDNVISGKRASFTDNKSRWAYMVSLLSGDAYLWYSNLASNAAQSPEGLLIMTYQSLEDKLLAALQDSDEEATAQRKLAVLQQGQGSAQEYAIKFQQYAYRLGWNDVSKMTAYREGLNVELLDQMITLDPAENLESLIQQSIIIDNRLFQYRALKQQQLTQQLRPVNCVGHPKATPVVAQNFHAAGEPDAVTYDAMDLSATRPNNKAFPKGPLPEAKKERRTKLGLCQYCRGNHPIDSCPKLAVKEKKSAPGAHQALLQFETGMGNPKFDRAVP
ncbi:protein of unknown function [Taphrina deformans PYCC 5710]|uniref:Retrotransposon gag domain-containing protein n=1 Tax=Taphrina deformans (strain PYCC 5710 / ATCC 11124 / CBS 356.35 / IMI 108563 / JCM 9778 / NBRC 8474) TaxID=1097556 RepID=R4X7P2_TAPDE|nr:protein of unknown function [Taphrina deformans PYCC 5710]|eukprot:CCG81456.1 protein of unknown function [Taphrina deformans PYCC 5710]